MAVPLAEQIIALCKEGLSAYKTYLATRQEAYNRQADKNQVKAIESGEKGFFTMDKIIKSIEEKGLDTNKLFKDDLKTLAKYRKRFFKFN